MIRKLSSCLLLFAAVLLGGTARLDAQKRPLDHDAYDGWESASVAGISDDGSIVAYVISPQEGDGRLVIRRLITGDELVIDRASGFRMLRDGSVGVCTIAPPYAVTRQAKIDKKKKEDMPKDTLALIDLRTFGIRKFAGASSPKMGYESTEFILASIETPAVTGNVARDSVRAAGPGAGSADQPSGRGKPQGKSPDGKTVKSLLLISLPEWSVDTLFNVSSYEISRSGDKYVYVVEPEKKDSSDKVLSLATRTACTILGESGKDFSGISFNAGGDKVLFMSTEQDVKSDGTPAYSVFLATENVVRKATRRTPAETRWDTEELLAFDSGDLPEGWVVAKSARPRFSNASGRVVLNLGRHVPAKDTTVVDSEAPGLDIWVWDSKTLPPMSKAGGMRQETLSAIVDLASPGHLLVVSSGVDDRVMFPDGADSDIAVSFDNGKYALSSMWDADRRSDISVVDLRDGSRRVLAVEAKGQTAVSPYGRYVLRFDPEDGNWYCMDIASGNPVEVNLTAATESIFYDDEDDHPMGYVPVGHPQWMGNDEYVLIGDRYDIWKFTPDGRRFENLTRGEGRTHSIRYGVTVLDRKSDPYLYQDIYTLPKKGRIWLTAFGEDNSKNGYATVNAASPSAPEGFIDGFTFSEVRKAADADVIVYLKGNFNDPMDVYVTRDSWNTETRLSDINPQQEEYLWGDVRMVRWEAYDGTPLKGLLYTPENLDTTGKYPMMIYFYEKHSENLYRYYSPAPSRSIINIPFYVSRGYVVFVPDIVYAVGHPGESAYNCICSGAEAMCDEFGFIDRDRMAIQGQSWGGYQTAYLVTRTDMFAAAGAGAPVGNMTSAYGGIRWESGSSRIGQYEHGQSRIGKTLWEDGGLDLYVENSPVFFAPNVSTPVLIMHNDADGAVPWYQGIEFFMSLRRLGKPAWLLEYNDEAHNLNERRNCKDLSIRLQQFFDHYLKDAPEPVWMKSGIPHSRKGNYFAYEYAE